jgi:TRAP-type uncharacterized transport system fused permease subunit
VFVFHPALLFKGSPDEIIVALMTSVIGVILLAIGTAGHLFQPLSWARRAMMMAAGLLLIPPPSGSLWLGLNAVGVVFGFVLTILEWQRAPGQASFAATDRTGC